MGDAGSLIPTPSPYWPPIHPLGGVELYSSRVWDPESKAVSQRGRFARGILL